MTTCIACDRNKPAADFAGEYTLKGKPLCDECFESDNEYVDVCARCGAVALDARSWRTPMLEEIGKALESLDDRTRMRGDGVLETSLRDPFDGEFYGRATITLRGERVHVDAWCDPYEFNHAKKPDWSVDYDSTDPKDIAENLFDRCPNCGGTYGSCGCERCHGCGAFLDGDEEEPDWCDYCH